MKTDRKTLFERFESGHIRGKDNECWPWLGSKTINGYGQMTAQPRNVLVHRMAYELFHGRIPDHLEIDHECMNRACCNPSHLKAVTHRENILRSNAPMGINARKTQCLNGHPFDSSNTRITKAGERKCRACDAIKARQRRAKRKQLSQTSG